MFCLQSEQHMMLYRTQQLISYISQNTFHNSFQVKQMKLRLSVRRRSTMTQLHVHTDLWQLNQITFFLSGLMDLSPSVKQIWTGGKTFLGSFSYLFTGKSQELSLFCNWGKMHHENHHKICTESVIRYIKVYEKQ